MKKAIAEFIGTFALVLIGCGTAVIAGMGTGATSVDILGIATAFGLTIVAMAYGIGQVSGCHINPAVSFGVLVAGRMTTQDFITYVIAQVLGAIAGAGVLYLILSGKASGWNGGLGQNGWGAGYLGEYGLSAAFIYEVVATFLFLVCILGVTQRGAPVGVAGLAIGLTLVAIHLLGINITGTSVNPARSLGPAIVGAGSNPYALAQVWLFIVAPLIGPGVAGYLFKAGILAADDVIPDRGGAIRRTTGGVGSAQAAVAETGKGTGIPFPQLLVTRDF
jgi:aquaporin Z